MEALIACLVLPLLLVVAFIMASATHQQRMRALRELAAGLEGGRAVTPDDLFAGLPACSVLGRLDGHEVRVGFERRGSGKHSYHVAILEVVVRSPAATFEVAEAGLLDRLGRWLGGPGGDGLGDPDLVLRRGQGAVQLFQASQVKAALRRVLDLPGVSAASLRGEALVVEQILRGQLGADGLRSALEALVALARRCDRVPLKVSVSARPAAPRFAWTDGDAHARCPYCRDALDPAAEATDACGRCGTAHHRACLAEAGGCTVFGCGARGARERA